MVWLLLVVCTVLFQGSIAQQNIVRCYDFQRKAQRCNPPFENAAWNIPVEATNTCGMNGPSEYCLQTGVTGATKSCEMCDARDPRRAHPARHLTDLNEADNMTWWQSETMLEDIQWPRSINLTLKLGKAFDITYVRLKFHSSRPESFAIYKRTNSSSPWQPYQYYSASCLDTYKRERREIITTEDETKAICTDEFSDISPLTGGSVAFSTLEGRPSAYAYQSSAVLQEWVTATDIMITLNRVNTFGDEVFGDRNVLKSYFYAITDFAVGGKCKCNGHASACVKSTGQGLEEKLVCQCEHNTMGTDCEQCLPFFNDKPWSRATAVDAHECAQCNCNGLSNRCYFDENLYRLTGHGGHCLDCRLNTAGPNCETCKDFHYRENPNEDYCRDCQCSPIGSENLQCDNSGRCRCKPGVTGDKCDRCQPNYFDFGPGGCRPCACNVGGSMNNDPRCLPDTGTCTCKDNVEGQNCDKCKPGFFNLDLDNPAGCMACFCYGHASICSSAQGYSEKLIRSDFGSGVERWTGENGREEDVRVQHSAFEQSIVIQSADNQAVHFVAPSRYLGDQRFSYNRPLTFKLRIGEDIQARASALDLIVEGNGLQSSAPIYAQQNPLPDTEYQDFTFVLHEDPRYQWRPQLSSMDFVSMLANLTAIKIRGTYNPQGQGYLDDVVMISAVQAGGNAVSHVEECTCPDGYVGQFCESCAPGYHREVPYGGRYSRCVPCQCNGHSDLCDENTGECLCEHNTAGKNCERCEPGYYGYALAGTPDDCKRCPCPDGGECVELLNKEVACINCREGYTGNRCQLCADGYSGDPQGTISGIPMPCTKCGCSGNIDPNAVGNCNTTTGECLKCTRNTGGEDCSECLPGYYGDALNGECKPCNCHVAGSDNRQNEPLVSCDQRTGQCPCLRNVEGLMCDQCKEGYWNIESGTGCELCLCDLTGASNRSCDVTSGQCNCRPGTTGRTCDECERYHYGFSLEGCKPCNCDVEGSLDMQCDERTGKCPCMENIEGIHCDRCMENKYNKTAGCIDCPPCYDLVQEAVKNHRKKIQELKDIIENIGNNPKEIDDEDFKRRLGIVNASVHELWVDAKGAVGGEGPIGDQLGALQAAVKDILKQAMNIKDDIVFSRASSGRSMIDMTAAEQAIANAEEQLRNAEVLLETDGNDALRKAREAQERFGQQSSRMTDIAKEARQYAEQHEKEAEAIQDLADDALTTSEEAYNIAKEAINQPKRTAIEIDSVRRNINEGGRVYDETEERADRARNQAKDSYEEALRVFTDAGQIQIPTLDVDQIQSDAQKTKDDAKKIKDDANNLLEDQRALLEDVTLQRKEAEELLENGERQQQVSDELLADADRAHGIAEEAIRKADEILKEANDTLYTLREFDRKVQDSRADAEDALNRIADIEAKLDEAEQKTDDSRTNLADAEQDANDARDLANEAKNLAEMASEDAGKIRSEAETAKENAIKALDIATQQQERAEQIKKELEEAEQRADEDERLAKEALKKANQAKTNARDSSNAVKDALTTVEDILNKLDNLEDIRNSELDALEKDLSDAEQKLLVADIDEKYNNLLAARQQQNRWVREYTDELLQLRIDVANVEKINMTIPRTCFKASELEPTEPSVGK